MNHLASLFPQPPDMDGILRARPYHKTVTDMLLLPPSEAPLPTLSKSNLPSSSNAHTGRPSSDSSDSDDAIPSPEQLDDFTPCPRPSSWAVDAQSGHSLFVKASLAELEGICMQYWQQPCAPQVPHRRYVLQHVVPHMVAAAAWDKLHWVLCKNLPALKALVEEQQVLPVLQHLSSLLQDTAATGRVLGEAGMADLKSLVSFLRFDQQELQSHPHQLLQEAWNSPKSCCMYQAARKLDAGVSKTASFWGNCLHWCNPPETFPPAIAVFQGHTNSVNTCTLTADGSRLVSGSDDNTLRVWDMSSMECVGTLKGQTGRVSTCTLTADGSRLVSGSFDNTLLVWDMSSMKCVGTLQGHTGWVNTCTLTADGSRLVSGSADNTLRVWDMSSMECVGTLQGRGTLGAWVLAR
jgi:hypothetical protein